MKSEKLNSTTVRFTESDLYLIERLQEKLGLGKIHIIRLAIRRLAENENLLLPTPSLRSIRDTQCVSTKTFSRSRGRSRPIRAPSSPRAPAPPSFTDSLL